MLLGRKSLRFMLTVVATVGINCFVASAQGSPARITGTITDPAKGSVAVRFGDFERTFVALSESCAGGRFEVKVPVERLTEVELSSGGEVLARVLVAPDQTLHIGNADGSPTFSGTAAEINATLHNYLKKMSFGSFTPSYAVATPEQFVAVLDRNIEIERERMERELSDAPESLQRWAEAEICYRNAGYAAEYAHRNRLNDSVSLVTLYNRGRFPIDTTGAVCLDYYAYLSNVVRDRYIEGDKLVRRLRVQRNYVDAYVAAIERVVVTEQRAEDRDRINAMILNWAYESRNQVFEQVVERIHDRQLVGDEVIERCDSARRGRADMRRFTEHTFERLLAESHHKVIYIDVWATWCPPCHREMKHLRKMEKRLEGEPIKFVSFCVSSPYPQWALTVDLPENRSANYWLDDEAQAVLDRYIHIRSFPRFFVLCGGEIVNDNIQWPSSNDLIDGLLRGYYKDLER